jgi:hypothetical protein
LVAGVRGAILAGVTGAVLAGVTAGITGAILAGVTDAVGAGALDGIGVTVVLSLGFRAAFTALFLIFISVFTDSGGDAHGRPLDLFPAFFIPCRSSRGPAPGLLKGWRIFSKMGKNSHAIRQAAVSVFQP